MATTGANTSLAMDADVAAQAEFVVVGDISTERDGWRRHASSLADRYPDAMGFSVGVLRGGQQRRGIVDHRLARRMLINQVRLGRISRTEVCDAHPELIRAATNVGTETSADCPVCDDDKLRIVTYVFGHRLPASGRCVTTKRELRRLSAQAQGELTAYVVEACPGCRWHHLLRVLPLSD